jgi:hypothetical protein
MRRRGLTACFQVVVLSLTLLGIQQDFLVKQLTHTIK